MPYDGEDFDIRGSYDGAVDPPQFLEKLAREWVQPHYVLAFSLIVVLGIYTIWMLTKKKECFNPTQTMGLTAQMVNGWEGLVVTNPIMPSDLPGGANYGILHSDAFGCATRTPSRGGAWDWMNSNLRADQAAGVGAEQFEERPKNDNEFSQILTGK